MKMNRLSYEDALNKFTYDDFYQYYVVELHSFRECKQKFNISQETLSRIFKHFNIKKTTDEIKKTNHRNCIINLWDEATKEGFISDYLSGNISNEELVTKYNLTNKSTIYNLVEQLKLPKVKNIYFRKSFEEVLKDFNSDYDYNKQVLETHSINELSEIFDTSTKTIKKLIDYLKIKREKLNVKRCQETKLERYGDKNYTNVEKIMQTNLIRYGKAHFVNQDKTYQTKLERYGDKNYNNREKAMATMLERYGDIHYRNPNKIKQTNLKKYGVENVSQNELVKSKISVSQLLFGNKKGNETKRKNNSFNISNVEKDIAKKLSYIYLVDDLYYQYNQDERYPFNCDFYIKSEDLFVELNLTWTHGGHRFNKNDLKDIKKLTIWQDKATTSEYYKNAIKTWTERDINKFVAAEKNKLNYKTIYNKKDAYKWIRELYKNSTLLFGLTKDYIFNLCQNSAFPGTKKWSAEHPIWDCYLSGRPSPKQAWGEEVLLKKAIDNLFNVLKNCILENKETTWVNKIKNIFENVKENPKELLEVILNRFTIAKIAPKVTAISKNSVLKIINDSNIDLSLGVYCPMAGFGGIIDATKEWFSKRNLESTNKIYASDINPSFCKWYGWVEKDVLSEYTITDKTVIVCPPFGKKYEHWKGTPEDMSNISFVDWCNLIKEHIKAPNYIFIGPELNSKNTVGLFSKTVGIQRWTNEMLIN